MYVVKKKGNLEGIQVLVIYFRNDFLDIFAHASNMSKSFLINEKTSTHFLIKEETLPHI
jgi:hypothetical protein